MSRLRRRARTCGGSVSGLLPTRNRRHSRHQAPPGPAALWPGSDLWRLRLWAHTGRHPLACPNGTDALGQSHHPSCMSVRHQRPWAKSPPCCMSVRHRHPWAMSTLKYRTVPRKIGLLFSQLSLRVWPMAASQRLLQVGLTAIKLQIHGTISSAERLSQQLMTHSGMVQTLGFSQPAH